MNATPGALTRRTGGDDAVCFTAGIKGPAFSAGVIHAWLAADRNPPVCAAGISFGAVSAAAMQRAYRELETAAGEGDEVVEVRRWSWFRKYLDRVTNEPLAALWRAVPHPSDLSADREPVQDESCPEQLMDSQTEARWNYFALMRFGQWFAGLPIRVSTVGRAVVAYIRFKEGYGSPYFVRLARFWGGLFKIVALLILHVFTSPQFCRGWHFQKQPESERLKQLGNLLRRPLFGWGLWSIAALLVLTIASTVLLVGWRVLAWLWPGVTAPAYFLHSLLAAAAVVVALVLVAKGWLPRVAQRLGIRRGLLHDYHAQRSLFELFSIGEGADRREPSVGEPLMPMPVVLVSAPLQNLSGSTSQQLYAPADASLVTALRAAVAIPVLFPPVRVEGKEAEKWLSDADNGDDGAQKHDRLDLVDGSVIRRNPLPALFHYLKHGQGKAIAGRLQSEDENDYRIHIVYNVPVEPLQPQAGDRERMNIVEAAFLSAELANRRDTKLERRQTNFISRLELELRRHGGRRALPIMADDIAPEREIKFSRPVAPQRKESLRIAANACRRTLGVLYREELEALGTDGVPCHELLESLNIRRARYISEETPGLGEVCRNCPNKRINVVPPPSPRASGVQRTFGFDSEPRPGNRKFAAEFNHLSGKRPRIAFVASGGVFRGATHIGVLAALRSMQIRPDLVVGASVGTLMNGALAALSTLDDDSYPKLLDEMCRTFFNVDQRVALTATLKGAVRHLGVRARRVALSPRALSRKFRRGARSDLSIATIGAPAELIDALSLLLLIPYSDTQKVAAYFAGGKFADATTELKKAVTKNTLRRLGIEHCLIGTSLLEPTARRLLGGLDGLHWEVRAPRMDEWQPFHHSGSKKVSIFSTTTSYNRKQMILLGRDEFQPKRSFDFVRAALSSSAFPVMFAPVQEADIFPGIGATNELFGDGGMFDNLPFFPAIEILAFTQEQAIAQDGTPNASLKALTRRCESPDLFIAAALDESPAQAVDNEPQEFDDLFAIRRRASILKNNLKIDAFRFASGKVAKQLRDLKEAVAKRRLKTDEDQLNKLVNAAVLKIEPSSAEHLNPTFACARSLGLKEKRVTRAIADGCFTTLGALAIPRKGSGGYGLLDDSLEVLQRQDRIPVLLRQEGGAKPEAGFNARLHCPYYRRGNEPFHCPFAGRDKDIGRVFAACTADKLHRSKHRGDGTNAS